MKRPAVALCALCLSCLPGADLLARTEITFRTGRVLVAESVQVEEGIALITLEGGGSIGIEPSRISSMRELAPRVPLPAPPALDEPPAAVAFPAPQAPAAPAPAREPAPPADSKAYILGLINEAAERHGVDRDLLRSLIEVESSLDPRSVSPKGAMGLAQLMPPTAAELGVTDPFDPVQAVDAAARLLKQLLAKSGGGFVGALAAYNAGQGAVNRYGGLPPYDETIRYIEKILTRYAAPR